MLPAEVRPEPLTPVAAPGVRAGEEGAGSPRVPAPVVTTAPLSSRIPLRPGQPLELPVLFNVDTAAPPAGVRREPFELCLVLDRSGSMQGYKFDAAKEAAVHVLRTLAEGDVCHLVIYDDSVETVFNGVIAGAPAESAQRQIAGLRVGGRTNISAALERARALLSQPAGSPGQQQGRRAQRRIFLLSDGDPNVGMCSADELGDLAAQILGEDIRISTFGIGSDIAQDVMNCIADRGGGTYHFLRTTVISQTVELAMSKVLRTCGTDAVIEVRPCSGVQVTRAHSSAEGPEQASADTRLLRVGDIKEGNHKQMLVRLQLEVPPGGWAEGAEVPVLDWNFSFRPTALPGEYRSCQGRLTVRATGEVHFVERDSEACDVAMGLAHVADLEREYTARLEAIRSYEDQQAAAELKQAIIGILEDLEPRDAHGYATAQLRRCRRVHERLQTGQMSTRDAVLQSGFDQQRLDNMSEDAGSVSSMPMHRAGSAARRGSYMYPSHAAPDLGDASDWESDGGSSGGSASPRVHSPVRSPPLRSQQDQWELPYELQQETDWGALLRERVPYDAAYLGGSPMAATQLQHGLGVVPSPAPRADSPEPYMLDMGIPYGFGTGRGSGGPLMLPQRLPPPEPAPSAPLNLVGRQPGDFAPPLPHEFYCPITRDVMTDPVLCVGDGFTYERTALAEWFQHNLTSPTTNQPLADTTMVPNRALRAQIATADEQEGRRKAAAGAAAAGAAAEPAS
eukprot:TRINITY_DN11114_c0_g1_i1.p1 TRINITY_DN11114_c0_g1~~TRINITY_DN11114_c0_g1_i1.p1  ORF type:complete len:776 (+),score=230.84 TRINITY_DN11114_c0_g1_i1:122-2329(+)